MPTDIATLGIKIEASDIRTAVRELDRLENQAKKTETKTNKLRRSFGGLQTAIGALGVGLLTRQVIQQINVYTALNNKLKLVTKDTDGLAKAHADLFNIAQDTRGSLEGTIDLYSRLARSTQELNISSERLNDVTKTVNQTIALSGASAATAQAALFQLGQGLGAGALRGEELNSVLEGTPELARAIATGLGVTIAGLREMGAAGELSAEKVIGALENQAASVDREYQQTAKTISQAMTQIENVALRTFGSMDASDLIESMDEFREIISDPSITSGLQSIAGVMLDIVNLGVRAAAGWGLIFDRIANFPDTPIENLRELSEKIGEINNEIKAAASSGRPYESLLNDLKETTAEYNQLKLSIDAANVSMASTGATGETGAAPTSPAMRDPSDALEGLRTAYASEIDLLNQKVEEEQLILAEAYLNKELSEEEHQQLMNQINSNYSAQRTEIDRQEAEDRLAFRQNLADQQASVEQTAFNHGVNLLRQFAGQSRTVSLILIGIQTAKAVKDIQIQATAAAAQVIAYGQVEAAAHSAMFNYPAAAAALARSTASAASIGTSATLATGLAIATGVAQAAALSDSDSASGSSSSSASSGATTVGSSVPVGDVPLGGQERVLRVIVEGEGAHSNYMRQLVNDLNETAQDMGGITSLVVS